MNILKELGQDLESERQSAWRMYKRNRLGNWNIKDQSEYWSGYGHGVQYALDRLGALIADAEKQGVEEVS